MGIGKSYNFRKRQISKKNAQKQLKEERALKLVQRDISAYEPLEKREKQKGIKTDSYAYTPFIPEVNGHRPEAESLTGDKKLDHWIIRIGDYFQPVEDGIRRLNAKYPDVDDWFKEKVGSADRWFALENFTENYYER